MREVNLVEEGCWPVSRWTGGEVPGEAEEMRGPLAQSRGPQAPLTSSNL